MKSPERPENTNIKSDVFVFELFLFLVSSYHSPSAAAGGAEGGPEGRGSAPPHAWTRRSNTDGTTPDETSEARFLTFRIMVHESPLFLSPPIRSRAAPFGREVGGDVKENE